MSCNYYGGAFAFPLLESPYRPRRQSSRRFRRMVRRAARRAQRCAEEQRMAYLAFVYRAAERDRVIRESYMALHQQRMFLDAHMRYLDSVSNGEVPNHVVDMDIAVARAGACPVMAVSAGQPRCPFASSIC